MKGTIKEIAGPESTAKEFRRAIKPALGSSVELWHEDMFPNHFKASAHFRYAGPNTYKRRSFTWQKKKKREKGHNNPLVFNGDLKRALLQQITITSTAKSASGRLRGTRYFHPFKRDAEDHDKAAEATATHPQELKTLSDHTVGHITDRLKRNRQTTVRRI